jgi:hypothetical protein
MRAGGVADEGHLRWVIARGRQLRLHSRWRNMARASKTTGRPAFRPKGRLKDSIASPVVVDASNFGDRLWLRVIGPPG